MVIQRVGRVGVDGPLEVAHTPPVGGVGAAVVGVGLERVGDVVGDEHRGGAGPAVRGDGRDRGGEIGLGGHVVDRVVHDDRVERAAEAHRAHVARRRARTRG